MWRRTGSKATKRRRSSHIGLGGADSFPLGDGKSFVPMNPPDPDVTVKNDHRFASQSLSATLSKGAA
jgi:hypothetical protein